MKERLKKTHIRRLRIILKHELNTKNRITAIGALAFPVLRHYFYNELEIRINKKSTGKLEIW
jgi:hypothetical protein